MPEEARARRLAAETLVASGRRSEADRQLKRAAAFYRRAGAESSLRDCEALLAALA